MTLSITNLQAIECADVVADSCDLGSGNAQATLVIYSGTPPTNTDTALSGNTVLAELDMSNPAFGAASDAAPGAIVTASAITDDSAANATGTATFFRILDRDDTPRVQGLARATGDADNGEELVLNTTALVTGAAVSVSSLTMTMPEA